MGLKYASQAYRRIPLTCQGFSKTCNMAMSVHCEVGVGRRENEAMWSQKDTNMTGVPCHVCLKRRQRACQQNHLKP